MAGEQAGYTATITYKTSTSTTAAVTLAKLTDVGLSVTAGTIDYTNRDSTGRWREKFSGFREWSGNAAFMFADANASQEGIYSVLDGTKQTFTFYPGGSTGGGTSWSGSGYVTGFEATAPDEEAVAHSIEFEGTGALTQST
jgi:predicted secreted protein